MSEADFTRAPLRTFGPLEQAEDDGFEAYTEGRLPCDNPYKSSPLGFFWLGGYVLARQYYGR